MGLLILARAHKLEMERLEGETPETATTGAGAAGACVHISITFAWNANPHFSVDGARAMA